MILTIYMFDLQVTLILPINFQSIGLSVQKKFKIDFQDGGHLGLLIRTNLAVFDLQVTQILPTKFPVKLAFRFRRISAK